MANSIDDLLASHPLLGTLTDEDRNVLSQHATLLTPAAGHYLLVAGNDADAFYLIESGGIMIEQATADGETLNIEQLRHNQLVGWSWLTLPNTWQFDALVTEPSHIWRFDAKAVKTHCEQDPRFGFELILRLTHTIVERLQNTRIRLIEETVL